MWSGTVLFQGEWYDFIYFILLGICIILNNETFANANTHPTRNGTNVDRGKFTRKSTRLSDYIQLFLGSVCIWEERLNKKITVNTKNWEI